MKISVTQLNSVQNVFYIFHFMKMTDHSFVTHLWIELHKQLKHKMTFTIKIRPTSI